MDTNSMSYKSKQFLMFAGVTTAVFAAVVIVPFIYGLYLTFTSWDGISTQKTFCRICKLRGDVRRRRILAGTGQNDDLFRKSP